MAELRTVTNHYALHASARSDYLILANPEYRFGRHGAHPGNWEPYDQRRCASRPAKSIVRDQMTSSMRMGNARLLGPREFESTLQERALARSASAAHARTEGSSSQSWRERAASLRAELSKQRKGLQASTAHSRSESGPIHAWRAREACLRAERSRHGEGPEAYSRGPDGITTVGKWRYVPPPEMAEIMRQWAVAKEGNGFTSTVG
eukprot:CAMPEP_0171129390 /NCGR_PEP_ID=MMETSP0766_2-20121228/118872_1 /TAXON_ID=439317 /ORGANISM="Gambierdiscus australes, Strain CAWD 149" /LENGTH=205 /DNA_ID=CAMNT_0011592585 /DNA_START=15 /DNA_END=632 /DNA_ORIENTATION=-